MKRTVILLLVLVLAVALANGQEVMLAPQGVSPAMIKADTLGNENYLGIYDIRYSGLLNVGVGTKMYLKGWVVDGSLHGPNWTVALAPEGSAAAIGTTVQADTATVIATFTPDLPGTYVVQFDDGGTPAELTINAAKYTGIEGGGCAGCHADKAAEWEMTGHAVHLTDALNGMDRSGTNCLPCHTTGFDPNAANDGFDDFPFEYPAQPGPGVADSLAGEYPDAMARANIQCEACHGPGSAHYGKSADSKMVSSLAVGACAVCHDDDHYHVYPSQWEAAGHSEIPTYPGGTRTTCRGCHNGAQFIQFVEGKQITVQPHVDITCAVCHDPHSAENPEQLRTMEATLSNGQAVEGAGRGAICMNCHQSRREANSYTNTPQPHYGPHYAPQADMLIGTNAVTFGKTLPTSPHLAATGNACVTCHMYEKGSHGEHDEEGNLNTSGMHSFAMVNKKGVDNVAACADCHGDIGTTFAEKKFYMNGNADHDGDGVEEGLQDEVHGLMDILGSLLPSDDPHANVDTTWTRTELKAAFNHRLVYYDHSYGIHNPAFTVSLLKVTIQALLNNAIEGEIVAIEDIPNDQGKQVWIIWDKFVDDGVAVDPVVQYVVKRNDGAVWTGVGQHPADGSNRYALVVPTLFDSTAAGDGMTEFKVVALTASGNVHESVPASGYSVDNLVPMAPTGFLAALSGNEVNLTWDESEDVDFNYFAIYKGTEAGFVPSAENRLATTTGTEFFDSEIEAGNTYYYKIAAYDFSGNESEFAVAEPVVVSGVKGKDKAVPTEFSLAQNYPNPFNPSTVIEFGVPHADDVTITIYDIRGSYVRTLAQGKFAAGYHSITWDGRDDNGTQVSAGTYLYRLESGSHSFTKKAIFLK